MTSEVNLPALRSEIDKLKGKREQLLSDIEDYTNKIKKDKKHLVNLEKAKVIVDTVGLITQNKLKFHISDIASLALESIFPDPYQLVLEFENKRGSNECSILFERNGFKVSPEDSSGIGAVDVAAFALRTAAWSMNNPRPNNVILLDEPFKHLSDKYVEPASMMIKELSTRLNLQFIVITHNPDLATYADREIVMRLKKTEIDGKTWKITKTKIL